jgi:hypothetical protein
VSTLWTDSNSSILHPDLFKPASYRDRVEIGKHVTLSGSVLRREAFVKAASRRIRALNTTSDDLDAKP